MTAVNPLSADSSAVPKRIPKLAVRNRTSGEGSQDGPASPALPEVDEASNLPSSQSSNRTMSPALGRRHSEQSQRSGERLRTSGSDSTKASDGFGKKKKASGVLGFLTLKEPSTSAWEEFAQTQRKAAAQRNPAGGMPCASSKKLPTHVPKTNSKWDGLPDNAKRKASDAKPNRPSTTSTSSRGSGDRSPAKRYGSLSSRPSRSQSTKRVSLTASVIAPELASEPPRATTSSSEPPRARPSAFGYNGIVPPFRVELPAPENRLELDGNEMRVELPEDGHTVAELDSHRSPQTFLHPPSPPPGLPELSSSPLSTPELETPNIPQLLDSCEISNGATSSETSPQTPPIDNDQQFTFLPGEDRLVQYGAQHRHIDPNGTFLNSDTENEDAGAKPSRRVLNFSRPIARTPPPPVTDENVSVESSVDEGYVMFKSKLTTHDHLNMPPLIERGSMEHEEFPLEPTFDPENSETDDEEEQSTVVPTPESHVHEARAAAEPSDYFSGAKVQINPVDDEEEIDSDGEEPVANLRDNAGCTSPFIFVPGNIEKGKKPTKPYMPPSSLPLRPSSTSSRMTNLTVATDTTATYTVQSPTFSEAPSESTRPSSATSCAAARRRPSLSPIRSNSDAASIAPSEMSVQWTMSPKERLGLGGKVIRRDHTAGLPWEVGEAERRSTSSNDPASKRHSTLSLETRKLKRLSMRLGRK